MTIRMLANETQAWFDLMKSVNLSPNGELVLSQKDEAGVELFRAADGAKIALPSGANTGSFLSNSSVELSLVNGAVITWAVPEGEASTIEHVRTKLQAQSQF
jgi:hypothetical protein